MKVNDGEVMIVEMSNNSVTKHRSFSLLQWSGSSWASICYGLIAISSHSGGDERHRDNEREIEQLSIFCGNDPDMWYSARFSLQAQARYQPSRDGSCFIWF